MTTIANIANIADLAKRPSELEILTSLVNLMAVINRDKDDGWFICEEAGWVLDEARDVIHRRIHGEQP